MENVNLINEVYKKVGELQSILNTKMGNSQRGGENKNQENLQGGFTTNLNNDKINIYKANDNLINNSGQGGLQNMKPITRDGEPVQDGKLVDPKLIASMAQGGDIPQTDLLSLAKSMDPYNESNVPAFNRVGSGIDTLESEQKKTQSVEEHKKIEPVVEKKVSASEIQDVVNKVKELKRANKEIDEIVTQDKSLEQEVDKPVRATLESIRQRIAMRRQAETKDRPLQSMDKPRYQIDKGNSVRDQEAKDAISKGDKDINQAEKEPKQDRPLTHKGGYLNRRGMSVTAKGDGVASDVRFKPESYTPEKTQDMDFEGSASSTQKTINKEHSEREKEKSPINPMKTVLWNKQDGTEKKAYVVPPKGDPKNMSWEQIIQFSNDVFADLQSIFGEVNNITTDFTEQVDTLKKAGLLVTAKEDHEESETKEEEVSEHKDKKEPVEKSEKKDSKPKSKKDPTQSLAKDSIELIKDIKETVETISEDIDEHLEEVGDKVGPISAKPPMGKIPGKPDMLPGREPMGEGLPEELKGIPGLEQPGMKMEMGASWVNNFPPKTAAEEEQVTEQIMQDPALDAQKKKDLLKSVKKMSDWKAVFTKIGSKDNAVDKTNSFWSVYRGPELVIRATVEDLYKDKAVEAFDWCASDEYGKKLLSSVLNEGICQTASKLGIGSMVKISKEGKKTDEKSYWKKVYPASYVSELMKDMRKKYQASIDALNVKVGDLTSKIESFAKENVELKDNQVLHAKAEKSIQLCKLAVEKGLIQEREFDTFVDEVTLMDDQGFETFSKMVVNANKMQKQSSVTEKVNELQKFASDMNGKSPKVDLKIPLQTASDPSMSSGINALQTQLEDIWKKPGAK